MENATGFLSLQISDRPVDKTVQYLLYRVYLKHPGCYGIDRKQTPFTHRGRYLPGQFSLAVSDEHQENDSLLSVQVTRTQIRLTWSLPLMQELAHYLYLDPVWGPDYGVSERVKLTDLPVPIAA